MIASISGTISFIGDDFAIINVGGVGFKVCIPKGWLAQLKINQPVFVHTHLVVREDLLALYGFETIEQKEFFNLLIGISGIGPKSGMSILSCLSIDQIKKAVVHNQPELLSKVPGIGMKTAQKLVLFLQNKISADATLQSISSNSDVDTEIMQALTSLGYSVLEAQTALQSIPRDAPPEVDVRLKLALQYFSK